MSRLWRPLLQKCLPRGTAHSVFCTFNRVLWPVFLPATSARAYMSLGPDENVNSPTLTEPVESIFSDSTAAQGHETSLDLSSGSSDSIERQPHSLAHFFAGILRPSFEDIEVAVKACVASQNSLQSLLERLSLDLSRLLQSITNCKACRFEYGLWRAVFHLIHQYRQHPLSMTATATSSSSSKSVTQFLRSLDLTGVDFGAASQHVASCAETPGGSPLRRSKRKKLLEAASQVFPSTMPLERMSRLETLKLRDADLSEGELPSQLTHLSRLEYLSLAKNKLTHLTAIADWPAIFPRLRVLNCRRNALSAVDSIPSNIFECPNLQVIDFSCNNLTRVPRGLENASGLLVLNLSENQLTAIPEELFVQCTNLMLLDLSDNQLQTLPAHLRRCSSLQQLILSRNPLQHYPLRAVAAIKHLQVLHLSNTQRRLDNIPSELDRLEKLVDLDLSENQLNRIPEPVFQLRSLRKLDVSRNSITDLSMLTDNWPNLEYLNLSYNQLLCLPSGLTRLTKLRKLYINNNQLKFDGIPSGIGKLNDLEVFDASHNLLENIPEGLCRCGRLKRLLLSSNRLVTLPDAIHFLIENLEKFDVEDNPNLRFPERPTALQKGAGSAFYNIDFSLEAQLQLLRGGQTSDATSEATNAKIFRTHFVDWEPAMAVDFTRTARSIAERGSDLNVIFERDKMKTDLRALLAPRDSALGWDEAMQLMQELNHELFEPMELNADFSHGSPTPSLQQFILDRDWVPVEPQWFGHFFNKDAYIVIARYWPLKVEFKRVRQQQEDLYFLAHFMRRMVIHSGHYRDRDTPERQNAVQLYHLRMNGNPIATRCIEVKPTPTNLNSCFSYICRIPASKLESFAAAPSSGRDQVYIWVGDHAHEGDEPLLEAICHQIYSPTKTEVLSISEGGENDAFWNALGGKRNAIRLNPTFGDCAHEMIRKTVIDWFHGSRDRYGGRAKRREAFN
nr:unnamed protein product [Spirometra erinaceieuropaei]